MALPVLVKHLLPGQPGTTGPVGIGADGQASGPPSSYMWGIVLDGRGRPVGGATVTAQPWRLPGPAWLRAAAGQPEARAQVVATATSGPAGLFLLPLKAGRYDVVAGAPGFALRRLAAERSPHPGLVAELERGYSIAGTATGLVQGSVVMAEPLVAALRRPVVYTQPSPDGRFELQGLGLGAYRVVATTPAGERAVLDEVPAGTADLKITILPRGALVGRTLHAADAAPVAGARVWVAGSGIWPPRSVVTDGAGRFSFEGLPAGWYALRATRRPDLASAFVEGLHVAGGKAWTERSLILAPARSVRLLLRRAESGLPVAGAAVTLAPRLPAVLAWRGHSDAKGHATLGPLPPGVYEVDIRGPKVAPALGVRIPVAPPEPGRSPGTSLMAVDLPAPGVLSGNVVDPAGTPVRHARCYGEAQGVAGAALGRSGDARIRARLRGRMGAAGQPAGDGARPTDSAGRFRLPALPQGTYRVLCQHPAYQPGSSAEIPVPSGAAVRGVKVVLRPGAQVKGRVVNLEGDPVAAAVVRFGAQAGASTDRRGRFTLLGLSGPGLLTVDATGYGQVQRSLTVVPGQQQDRLVITLDNAVRPLRGHVVGPNGAEQVGAHLVLRGAQDLEQHAVSGPNGAFEFSSPPPPPWKLSVSAWGAALW